MSGTCRSRSRCGDPDGEDLRLLRALCTDRPADGGQCRRRWLRVFRGTPIGSSGHTASKRHTVKILRHRRTRQRDPGTPHPIVQLRKHGIRHPYRDGERYQGLHLIYRRKEERWKQAYAPASHPPHRPALHHQYRRTIRLP